MLQEELEKLEMYKSQSTDKETIISEIQTAVKTISFHMKELRELTLLLSQNHSADRQSDLLCQKEMSVS